MSIGNVKIESPNLYLRCALLLVKKLLFLSHIGYIRVTNISYLCGGVSERIMESVNRECGLGTEAGGIICACAVDSAFKI